MKTDGLKENYSIDYNDIDPWLWFQIIESRLKVVLPEDLSSALRDGVVLCHLANHLRPHSVARIHVPSHAAVSALIIYISHVQKHLDYQ